MGAMTAVLPASLPVATGGPTTHLQALLLSCQEKRPPLVTGPWRGPWSRGMTRGERGDSSDGLTDAMLVPSQILMHDVPPDQEHSVHA